MASEGESDTMPMASEGESDTMPVVSEGESQAQGTADPNPNQAYIDDLNHLLSLASHPRTSSLLQGALEEARRELLTNGGSEEGSAPITTPISSSQPAVRSVPPLTRIPLTHSTRISQYGWDQSSKFVKIYISGISDLPQLTKDCLHVDFKERSLDVEIKGLNRKVYSLVINDLLDAIIPDQSFSKLRSGMVVVSLKKSRAKDWPCLTGREKRLKDAREPKPPKMDKNEDPGGSLMSLMKQMYQDGDDDMKRTIAKAWQESQEKRKDQPDAF